MNGSQFKLIVFVSILIYGVSCRSKTNAEPPNANQHKALIQKGKLIAKETFLALSSELQAAVAEGGFEHAVTYCNTAALPLTDSISNLHQVNIKRATDKPRNSKNAASPEELLVMNDYREKMSSGASMEPILREDPESYVFHAPILAQALCLNCHGNKEDIKINDQLAQLYPNDQAVGYQEGDLRGLWSITFKK